MTASTLTAHVNSYDDLCLVWHIPLFFMFIDKLQYVLTMHLTS